MKTDSEVKLKIKIIAKSKEKILNTFFVVLCNKKYIFAFYLNLLKKTKFKLKNGFVI
jgi:hypothetical protein